MMKAILNLLLFLALSHYSCTQVDPEGPISQDQEIPQWSPPVPLPVIDGDAAFTLEGLEDFVNVMEDYMPPVPTFPVITAKEGKISGFVADLSGRPVQGAHIGIRSSLIGGTYSSALAETNENGYYEMIIPWGAATIFSAGYTIDYGTGKAAMSLYPADGKIQSFESPGGLVKNFVLLSYGLADESIRAEKPWSSGGYFGGSLKIHYDLGDPDDIWATPGSLPYHSEIVVKLTPSGETQYGETRTFTVTKKVETLDFTINNIPVGKYHLTAQLNDGRALKIKQTGPYVAQYPHHGLKPKEAVQTVQVYFTPMSVEAKTVTANYGPWRPVDIKVELP